MRCLFYRASFLFLMGVMTGSTAFAQSDLPGFMRKQGVRRVVDLAHRPDLRPVQVHADEWTKTFAEECSPETISEVRMIQNSSGVPTEVILGYEATLGCEDSPSAAIALYFDIDQKFLGSLDLGG